MRHDTLFTRLGERSATNSWRLWIEDSGMARLSRNSFTPGAALTVRRSSGSGVVIESGLLGSQHVSARGRTPVLSFEGRVLREALPVPEVRVKVTVGKVFLLPMVRFTTFSTHAEEAWNIVETTLTTSRGTFAVNSARPLTRANLGASGVAAPTRLSIALTEGNLVCATEIAGTFTPSEVVITGAPLLRTIAAQFLRAIGYGEAASDENALTFRR